MKRLWLILLLTLGCSLTRTGEEESAPPPTTAVATPSSGIQDAGWLLNSACYEGMASLHNQILILSDTTTLDGFYTSLDALCPEPIQRQTFDFATQVLVVAVMVVKSCDAQLTATGLENNNLMLQFVQTGDCPFDVVATFTGAVPKPTTGELKVTVTNA